MENASPRLWTYTPSNSPVALPKDPLFFNSSELLTLQVPHNTPEEVLSGKNLQDYCASFVSDKGTVDELLSLHESPPMTQRRPFLLLGELANPYRLQDIGVGPMPIFTVRMTDLCRTYADALDNREVVPGVHHITLARTEGWWERSHIGMATVEQMKHMVAWLDQGRKGLGSPFVQQKVVFISNHNKSTLRALMKFNGTATERLLNQHLQKSLDLKST